MEKLRFILNIILFISIILNVVFICNYNNKNTIVEYREKQIIKRDTVINYKYSTDTIFITKEKIKYDTIVVDNIVYIKDIPQTYEIDSTDYNLKINATKLYWYQLDIHHQETIPVYDKVETIVKNKKQSPFGVSLFLGPTYDIYHRQFGVSVGVGFTVRLNK